MTRAYVPPLPLKNRSRASSSTSISSDRHIHDIQLPAKILKTNAELEDTSPAVSMLARHTLIAAIAMDPHGAERSGPRKLMSEENLKVTPAHGAAGRRQVLSSPPAPHNELSTAPLIPPRSSSRQSKAHKNTPGLISLGSKSSTSSMNSMVDPNGSSATLTTESLEIRSAEYSPDQQRLSPMSQQQRSAASSSNNSASSGPNSPIQPTFMSNGAPTAQETRISLPSTPSATDTNSIQPPTKSKVKYSQRSSLADPESQQEQELEQEQRHQEYDHHLTSVLDDIRSKTHHVLQKAGFSMAPTAGLYADHGSKTVDLTVHPSSITAAAAAAAQDQEADHPPTTQSLNSGISFAVNPPLSNNRPPGRRPSKAGSNNADSTSLSDVSVSNTPEPLESPSRFDRLRPWAKSEKRRRSNSGPAQHPDTRSRPSLEDPNDNILPYLRAVPKAIRQRRTSEATAITTSSFGTTYSCPPQRSNSVDTKSTASSTKHRSKHWFGIPKWSSAQSVEDTRKPHSLGDGIEGGITNRYMPSLMGDDEDEDTDGQDDDENHEEEGRKSGENSRLFINDYGFIYDLDDEMNQGQDLTGTGSNVGLDGALGSNASIMSDMDRKKAIKGQKYNRENEIKWIHAVNKLQADGVKKSSKYKKLVRRGIPTSVRGRAWLFLAKADVYRRPGLFEQLLKRGPLPIHEVIERDIHRCYPDHVHFRDGMGGTGQQDLHSILKAYAHYNPSVGYCQGMGRLVGMMLMQMPVEDAFWLLVATIEGYMQDYYTPTLRQLRIDAQVFERLLRDQDPALAEHLEKNDVIPLMYMTQWFMTLFTMSLPWASVLRVWDVFYYDGVKALFRVGLAILQLCRDHLLNKCPTSSELLGFILHIPLENLGPRALLETALQIKLTKHSVQKLIAVTAESMDAAASAKAKGPPSGDAFKNTQNPRKAGNTVMASNTTIFDIPEILAEILSYLDEPALRQSVVLVCRVWCLTSLPRLSVREVVWDDTRASNNNKEVDRILARLPGAFGLCWYSRPDRRGGIEESEPWQRLVGAVRRNYEHQCQRLRLQGQQRDGHRHKSLGEGGRGLVFQNLQKLELGGANDLGLATRTLLPLLPSLTILEMHTHARCSVSMGSVLLACPLLEQVHLSSLSVGAVELSWSWTPFGAVDSNNPNNNKDRSNKDRGKNDESSQQRHPSSLPLRSVVLENVSVELSGLEALLSVTPDLQKLKLIQLSASRTNQQLSKEVSLSSTVTNIATFFPRFKGALKRHGIILNSFHYSLDNEPPSTAAARLIEIWNEICHPRATEWSFWTSADLPHFAFQTLVQIPNVVTTLELHSSKIGRCLMIGCKLHQYLCESPHLLHLKAPRTAFLVDHFDIHGLVDATTTAYNAGTEAGTGAGAGHGTTVTTAVIPSASTPVPTPTTMTTSSRAPPIWKCRNLRTLHMAFRCSSHTQSHYYPPTLNILHLRSRILFGYLSRVLPELRDLRIDTSFVDSANYNVHESKLYLAFEGGFCLLSRLHFLERLSVDAVCQRVFYEPWELTWMLGSEEVDVEGGRKERRSVIAGLEQSEAGSMVERSATLRSRTEVTAPPQYLSCTACGVKTGRLRSTNNVDDDHDDYNDEQDLRTALENLGHVQDIVDVMDGLDAVSGKGEEEVVKCWPHLQKIALYRPNRYGLSCREEAIQQLVPDTFFQALVRRTFY
ncbi:hypothetical protein BGZ47_005028 [Haplosporangium gracile]|nr:hypothetical protein BGZ47_005028 [Haplosporangium gracile]